MAQDVVLVHGNGCRIRSEIHEYTTRALFAGSQYGIGQGDGSNQVFRILRNFYFSSFAAFDDILAQVVSGDDV